MKHVVVIGAGIAGLETASNLVSMGHQVTLVEKEEVPGGHLKRWHALFPEVRPSADVLAPVIARSEKGVRRQYGTEITSIKPLDRRFGLTASNGWHVESDAVVIASGFELFDARKKEEYGYGIYDNVITSAELEDMFNSAEGIKTLQGREPQRIGFVHCVGSRDEKAGNIYCSKVCCITAVKQAVEIRQRLPDSEVFCFYMDLRMFGRHYEELYKEAQEKYAVQFIRGRLSEAAEDREHRLVLKVEDTLLNKPLKISVDLLVLMSGMVVSKQTMAFRDQLGLAKDGDNFLKPEDALLKANFSGMEGVFFAGACTGPKNVIDSLADARSAALSVDNYLKKN
jgi:heterodisulfide reductase subunit A